VSQTAELLVEALETLKADGLLDVAALQSMPLDRKKYADGTLFAPLFNAVHGALSTRVLLPKAGGGWTNAPSARLARTQELRDLFDPHQLGAILGMSGEVHWLTGEITRDIAASLRNYMLYELKITELTPELIILRLNCSFLEAQSDEWLIRLYEFLAGQPALLRQGKAASIPLVRLENGAHVVSEADGKPNAYLPSLNETDFPTIRRSVCGSTKALEFLRSLGLTEPDLVDDVIVNVLPRYSRDEPALVSGSYAADIERILRAYQTDSDSRRNLLVVALRESRFVAAREQGKNAPRMAKPGDVYLATERLSQLFAGVEGVFLVDDGYPCLKGEDVRTLLVACGGRRYLEPVAIETNLDEEARLTIRREAGLERATWERTIDDAMLRGLPELLRLIGVLGQDKRRARAILLWDALAELESQKGSGAFLGTYSWGYFHEMKTARFDAAFIRILNETSWITESDGLLRRPFEVLFDSLGWKPNPFLLSKIRFKPPILDQLAREAGIEPGILDLLKKLGVTSEADLRQRLGMQEKDQGSGAGGGHGIADALKELGITATPEPTAPDPTANDPESSGRHSGSSTGSYDAGASSNIHIPGRSSEHPFISYIGTHADDETPDPDGLDQEVRMALEANAIGVIRTREPKWQPTPPNNPGFDLFELGLDGQPIRWCEVKAMSGGLDDRSVGLSRTQFDCAREHGSAYWIYVVEHAGSESPSIVRIQDPAGRARTFTFDRGWRAIAESDSISDKRGE
jgi:hypothetical protein